MKAQTLHLNSDYSKEQIIATIKALPVDQNITVTIEKGERKVTRRQFNALHVWCEALAIAWQIAGVDKREVFDKMKKGIEVPWTKQSVKEDFLKPIMKAMTKKESTKDLTTTEASELVELINTEFLVKRFNGMRVEFPERHNE